MRKNFKGYTLVEVLVSIVLLTMVLAGSIGFYCHPQEVMALNMHKKIAMELGTQQIEQMRVDGYASLPNPASGSWETAQNIYFGSSDFIVQKQRRVTDQSGAGSLKLVEMKFTWAEPGKQNQEIDLATFIAP